MRPQIMYQERQNLIDLFMCADEYEDLIRVSENTYGFQPNLHFAIFECWIWVNFGDSINFIYRLKLLWWTLQNSLCYVNNQSINFVYLYSRTLVSIFKMQQWNYNLFCFDTQNWIARNCHIKLDFRTQQYLRRIEFILEVTRVTFYLIQALLEMLV